MFKNLSISKNNSKNCINNFLLTTNYYKIKYIYIIYDTLVLVSNAWQIFYFILKKQIFVILVILVNSII